MSGPLILNRYRLLENRGQGGFGTVDVAWDTRLQRRVAIKSIPLAVDVSDLPGIQEARTAAMLNDPHIVNVLDFDVTGTEALLIMEYVDGPTLSELMLQSEELLSLDVVTAIVTDVASALEFAHENAVLHLDIKPDNIIIDHGGHCKVSDFGLAELSGTAGFAEPQGGTVGYMPLEQLTMGEVDERTDQWALAVLTYQLLTGSNPFYGASPAQSHDKIRAGLLDLPSELRPELAAGIDEALLTALHPNREQRWPSVAEFNSQLAPWLGSTAQGRKKLKATVNMLAEEQAGALAQLASTADEDKDSGAQTHGVSLIGRLPKRVCGLLLRLAAALSAGSMTWLGMSGLLLVYWVAGTEHTGSMIGAVDLADAGGLGLEGSSGLLPPGTALLVQIVLTAFVALAAFLMPQLGSILALAALAIGIAARGYLVVGAVVAAIGLLWWVFIGRKGPIESLLVLICPLFGALSLSFAAPLLAGWTLSLRRALPTALLQGLLLAILAGLLDTPLLTLQEVTSTGGNPLEPLLTFIQLQTWLIIAFLVGAAACMHAAASRPGIGRGLLGCGLATIVLTLPTLALPLTLAQNPDYSTIGSQCIMLALSSILVMVLIGCGLPGYAAKQDITQEED